MSAPNTDPDKQKERHKAPLFGMRAVIMWAVGLLALLVLYVVLTGNDPQQPDEVVDSRTGEVTETEGGDTE